MKEGSERGIHENDTIIEEKPTDTIAINTCPTHCIYGDELEGMDDWNDEGNNDYCTEDHTDIIRPELRPVVVHLRRVT